jgi:hypothetical protein
VKSTTTQQSTDAFDDHLSAFVKGHRYGWRVPPDDSPVMKVLPSFKVAEIVPGPQGALWTYISSGLRQTSSDENSAGIEFAMLAQSSNMRCCELLSMTAFYHARPVSRLGLGHTLPIGEPWWEGSSCDHILVSHLYPYGDSVEIWHDGQRHGHILWLLPITRAERDFKAAHGLETLERKFEAAVLQYWLPERASVV